MKQSNTEGCLRISASEEMESFLSIEKSTFDNCYTKFWGGAVFLDGNFYG